MDKKEIYEHLAKIYLDASSKSSKKKKRVKSYPPFVKNIFLASIALIFIFGVFAFSNFKKDKPFSSEVALVLLPEAAKINFNFQPAKKESYQFALGGLDLTPFKALEFSLKKSNYKDTISLRVEFLSRFREKSEVYIKDIPQKWQDYKINLAAFKNIADWSRMQGLSFIVEEWNTKEAKGVVYLDNVRLLK